MPGFQPFSESLRHVYLRVTAIALWIAASTAAGVYGQITVASVTDAASYGPRVAPGSLGTIFGSSLANSTASARGLPLPTTLGGARVLINGAAVPLLYASPTQINFQAPRELAAGTASLIVASSSGGSSSAFSFAVTPEAPGIFQDSSNNAAAQSTTYQAITSKNPAAAGSTVIVYLTGIGPVDNPVADGAATPATPLANATATHSASIGGVSAKVRFLGLSPGFAGLAQANIEVPATLATGTYPLSVTIGGLVSASAQIAVSGSGTAPASVLSLTSQVPFANGLTSSVNVLDTLAYVCSPQRISIVDLTSFSYVGEFGDSALLGGGGICALNDATGSPILVDATQISGVASYLVYSVALPLQPIFAAQPPLYSNPSSGIALQNVTSLSFTGPYSVSTTNWYTFDNKLNIAAQYGDFFTFAFNNPAYPAVLSFLNLTAGFPASSESNPKPNGLVVPQNQLYNPIAAYICGTTAVNTSTGNALLTVVDLTNISVPTPVQQLVTNSAAVFTGFGYQFALYGEPNLLLITGNTANIRNPGITDPATGAANFAYTGYLTLTTAYLTNTDTALDFENITSIGTAVTTIQTNGTYYVQGLGGQFFALVTQPPATDLNGPATLMIVDARTPASPVVYPVVTAWGLSSILVLTNGTSEYLLAPTAQGLNVYTVTLP
jgi:uncharacterized protein (TIGR03437 family)